MAVLVLQGSVSVANAAWTVGGFKYQDELWRAPSFAPKYLVSSFGRVARAVAPSSNFARRRAKTMKTRLNDEGYPKIKLVCADGKRRDFFVHLLVLTLHAEGVEKTKSQMEAARGERLYGCHKNNKKLDNRIENLYWGTHADNHKDKVKAGTHANGAKRKLTHDQAFDISRSSASTKALAARYGISISHVREIRSGRKWKR